MTNHSVRNARAQVALLLALLLAGLAARAEALLRDDFAGAWQFKADDGTYEERVELSISGDQVRGTLASFKHGYFSNRSTQESSFRIEGSGARGARLSVHLVDESNGGTPPRSGGEAPT
jgi:hypothetical protein